MRSIGTGAIRIRFSWCLAVAIALTIIPASAFARSKVIGDFSYLNIEAQNCPIQEVLDSLADKLNFHYHSNADLAAQITGIYQGSLLHILPRLLRGYSYFVKSDSGRLDLTVFEAENFQARSKAYDQSNQSGYLDNSARSDFGHEPRGLGAEKPHKVKPEAAGDRGNQLDSAAEPEFGG